MVTSKGAKGKELDKSWEELLARHSKPLERGAKARGLKVAPQRKPKEVPTWPAYPDPSPGPVRTPQKNPMMGSTPLATPKVYTGTKMIGLATMHKSNTVPVFTQEAAIDVATMRRN